MSNFLIVIAFVACMAYPVLSESNKLTLEPAVKELFLKVGQAQELLCSATDTDDGAELKWIKPSDVGVTDFNSKNKSGNKTSLVFTQQISSFDLVNAGEYKCQLVKGDQVIRELTIFLYAVTENKTEPKFVKDSANVTLSCGISLDHEQMRSAKWYKAEIKFGMVVKKNLVVNEQEEINNKYKEEWDKSTSTSSLIITDPKIEDSGLYSTVFEFQNSSYTCDVEFQAAPVVQDFAKSKNIIQEEKLELKCIVKGYPAPIITWLKNNETHNSTVESSSANEHVVRLYIQSVDFEDSGDYTCRVDSSLLKEPHEHTVSVKVKDKLAALWPFLGIVVEVIVLCTIIFIYEKRRNRQVQLEEKAAEEVDGSATDKKEGLRHRNTNPTA